MALESQSFYWLFFFQHYSFATLKVFLFTAQGKSAFAQFKEVDPAFEKQHSILTTPKVRY